MSSNTSSATGLGGERSRLDQVIADALRIVWKALLQLAISDRLAAISKCRSLLDAIEAQAIAERLDAGASSRNVEDLLNRSGSGGVSKMTVKKRAKRGAAVRDNPSLAKRMATGGLSDEQLDVIADASAKTNGEAGTDEALIDRIAAAPPEQGKKLADEYVRERMSQDDVDNAHNRARRRRRVSRYSNTERGTDVIFIEGAPADIDEIEVRLDELADRFYREDGGRDVAEGDHRRTRDQRRFDAAQSLICGRSSRGSNPNSNTARATTSAGAESPVDGSSHTPSSSTASEAEPTGVEFADADADAGIRRWARAPDASWKTTIVITASLDQALGNDPSPPTLADGSVLPSTVIERLACDAEFVGQIFGQHGAPLHHGRAIRDATFAQRIALVVRDGGCARCSVHYTKCVVHHLVPWTSRLRGKTNIDEMVLVCVDCHHHIHDNELTMFQDNEGIWRLRKATPNEIAPKRQSSTSPAQPPASEVGNRTKQRPPSAKDTKRRNPGVARAGPRRE